MASVLQIIVFPCSLAHSSFWRESIHPVPVCPGSGFEVRNLVFVWLVFIGKGLLCVLWRDWTFEQYKDYRDFRSLNELILHHLIAMSMLGGAKGNWFECELFPIGCFNTRHGFEHWEHCGALLSEGVTSFDELQPSSTCSSLSGFTTMDALEPSDCSCHHAFPSVCWLSPP